MPPSASCFTHVATIVWIFKQYADGMSPVRIAEELNARGVSGPRARLGRGPQFAGIEIAAAAF